MITPPSIPEARAWNRAVVGADGTRLRLYRLRDGRSHRDVLIVGHCNGFAAGAYLPLLEALAGFADVFAFDHRGHGGAENLAPEAAAAMDPDALAGDVHAIISAVAAERPNGQIHYFGHSLSAAAILRLGIGRPEDFSALPLRAVALMEPPIFPDADHELFEPCTARTIELIARTRRRRTRWPDRAAFTTSLRRYPIFAAFDATMLDAYAEAVLHPVEDGVSLICDPATEAAIFATWGRPILYPFLASVPATHRLHLIGGDPTMPDPDWVTLMMPSVAQRLPGCRFEIMPGRGHLWPFEAPREVADWIARTLIACDKRPRSTVRDIASRDA